MGKSTILGASIIFLALFVSGCTESSDTASPKNAKTYAVSKSIWKSEDGGETWTAKNQSKEKLPEADLNVLNIAINPEDSQNILVGLKTGGFIKSENGGDVWQKTIFVSDRVYGLAFDPLNSETIYASGVWQNRGKLFRSRNSGESWEEIFTSPSDGPFISALNIDNKNPKIIYASTSDNQTIKSEDGGNTWKNVFQSNSPIVKISLDKFNSKLIYAITLSGQVFRSSNGGAEFENIGKNFSKNTFSINQEYGFLETDLQNPGWVYLAGEGGILRSKDAGDNWEKIVTLNDPKNYPVTAMAVNPKNSQEMAYGAGQAVYRSVDGGQNWATSQFDLEKTISVIKYDPQNPRIIYVGFKKQ